MHELIPETITTDSEELQKQSDKFELDIPEAGRAYFKELAEKAVFYKSQVSSAKTDLKKEYFTKKLLKVNKKIYAILGMSFKRKTLE